MRPDGWDAPIKRPRLEVDVGAGFVTPWAQIRKVRRLTDRIIRKDRLIAIVDERLDVPVAELHLCGRR